MQFQLLKIIRFTLIAGALCLCGCSTGEILLQTNVNEGFIGSRKIKVYLAEITGSDEQTFRQELSAALSKDSNVVLQPYGMLPDLAGDTSSAGQGIIISGIHDLYENSRTLHDASVEGGGERMETDHVSEFQYTVRDAVSMEELSSGDVQCTETTSGHSSSSWGSIIGGIFRALSDLIVAPDTRRRLRTIDEFVRSIMIHTETRNIILYSEKDLPELKEGIDSARSGNWKKAAVCFQAGVENYPKQKDLYKAYYNLGMAYECIIEYEKAITAFSLANELHQDARFQSEIEYCERSSRCLEWREKGKR